MQRTRSRAQSVDHESSTAVGLRKHPRSLSPKTPDQNKDDIMCRGLIRRIMRHTGPPLYSVRVQTCRCTRLVHTTKVRSMKEAYPRVASFAFGDGKMAAKESIIFGVRACLALAQHRPHDIVRVLHDKRPLKVIAPFSRQPLSIVVHIEKSRPTI